MNLLTWIGAIAALGLLAYLVYALLRAEDF